MAAMRWLYLVKMLARLCACTKPSTLDSGGTEPSSEGMGESDTSGASCLGGAAASARGLEGSTRGFGAPLLSSSVIFVSQARTGLHGRLWKGFRPSFPEASLLSVYVNANLSSAYWRA